MQRQEPSPPTSVFCAAAPSDTELLAQWEKHLLPLQQAGLITVWSEWHLRAGASRTQQLHEQLDQAQVILFLLSAGFFASDKCMALMERAREGKARIIPLLLRPVGYETPTLADLPCLPNNGRFVTTWDDQDEAFKTCVDDLRRLLGLPVIPLQRPQQARRSDQDHIRMLGRLRSAYREMMSESLQGAVQEAERLELGLAKLPDAVRNTANLLMHMSGRAERCLPPGTSITQAYDEAEQELLILGEPGAGKSTLLLDLAQTLVARAEQDQTHRLPVILPLSSWAVGRLPLQGWMAEQLMQIYDVPRKLSKQWLREDGILPLLDGLDEMEETARAACIAAINTYKTDHREHLVPLVVCSRTAEYQDAAKRHRLAFHGAVVVQPLTHEDVDAYLFRAGESLAGLRCAINENIALREMVTTPLMLDVLMLTYRGITPLELPSKRTQLQQQVWKDYSERMVRRKGDNKRYPLENTRAWLGWLARQMEQHNLTVFYIEQMQPDWLRATLAYEWCAVRLPGFLLGTLVSLLISALLSSSFDPVRLIVYGFIGGHIGGLFSGAQIVKQGTDRQVKLLYSIARSLVSSILSSILIGVGVGLGAWFTIGQTYSDRCDLLHNEGVTRLMSALSSFLLSMLFQQAYSDRCDLLHNGVVTGLSSALSCFLLSMLFHLAHFLINFWRAFCLTKTEGDHNRLNPPSLLLGIKARDLGNGILVGFCVGLTFGLVTWQSFKQEHGPDYGATFGVHDGLTYGVTFILIGVLSSIILERVNKEIRPTEILRWLWSSIRKNLRSSEHWRGTILVSLIVGLGLGMTSGVSTLASQLQSGHSMDYWVRYIVDGFTVLSDGLTYGLTFGGTCWLLLGLYRGLSSESLPEENRTRPNEGIRRSLDNSVFAALVGGGIIGVIGILSTILYFGLHAWLSQVWMIGLIQGWRAGSNNAFSIGPSSGLVVGLQAGLFGGLLVCMLMGGLACFRHLVLRLLLWQSHKIPFDYPGFLNRAANCILLLKVRGGYRFVHREFQDYMASAE